MTYDAATDPPGVDLSDSRRVITVPWADGKKTVVSYRDLRIACRCAGCIDELTGKQTLKPELVPMDVGIGEVEAVGHYGIRFAFTDGHNTGIYTWERIRSLGAQ